MSNNINFNLSDLLYAASRICYYLVYPLCILTIVLVFAFGSIRPYLLDITGWVTSLVPSLFRGMLVFNTPFGGAFRGDFVLFAIFLNLVSRLLEKISENV